MYFGHVNSPETDKYLLYDTVVDIWCLSECIFSQRNCRFIGILGVNLHSIFIVNYRFRFAPVFPVFCIHKVLPDECP